MFLKELHPDEWSHSGLSTFYRSLFDLLALLRIK